MDNIIQYKYANTDFAWDKMGYTVTRNDMDGKPHWYIPRTNDHILIDCCINPLTDSDSPVITL